MTREIMEKFLHAMEEQDKLNKLHLLGVNESLKVCRILRDRIQNLEKRVEELEARERSMVE